jgi:prepilin-type N-terminal cleavage/methylation domain-containing protein
MLRNKKGLTVLEVMITLFVIGIVLSMVVGIVTFFASFYQGENTTINRQENIQFLLTSLERDVRFSDQTINFSGTCYIIGTVSTQEYCYDTSTKRVTRNGAVLANEIESFTLTTDTNGTRINVAVLTTNDSRGQNLQATYTIYLRQGTN